MRIRYLTTRAALILCVAGALAGLSWVNDVDRQVERTSLMQYCEAAATWAYEDRVGVPLEQRVGQPDHRGIAAEQCPGMQPALPAQQVASPSTDPGNYSGLSNSSTARQLARD